MIGGLIAPGDTMTVQFFRLFGSEPTYVSRPILGSNCSPASWLSFETKLVEFG